MSLCVIGRETLEELENMIIELGFGNIKRKNLERRTWTESPYGKNELAKKIEVDYLIGFDFAHI